MKKIYAFKNNKEEVLNSSSGGAFIEICKIIEEKHGKDNVSFYGATYDENMNVIHKRVSSFNECHIFQGSKYTKSNVQIVFDSIKKDIIDGKYVLFSGTPCQVAAVKKIVSNIKEQSNHVILIDIICHGTPKKRFWDDYKNWLEINNKSKLVDYKFRYKKEGWKAYPAYAKFANGKKLINTAETSIYSKMHMLGYVTEKGCFSCPFSNMDRQGDITLGDYWGIEDINPSFYDKNGVSLMIINTEKGHQIVNSIKKDNNVSIIETKGDKYISYQHNLSNKTSKPADYEIFWIDYDSLNFNDILKKYLNYNKLYKIKFMIKKIIRKTFLINIFRNMKKKVKQ